ncbi:MAG TPA: hypothetical protein VMF10_12140 [Candidatus Aquilonibacter sp.]|nr:hypothetical protein [Candidatus Aquilonibacter sp.]
MHSSKTCLYAQNFSGDTFIFAYVLAGLADGKTIRGEGHCRKKDDDGERSRGPAYQMAPPCSDAVVPVLMLAACNS